MDCLGFDVAGCKFSCGTPTYGPWSTLSALHLKTCPGYTLLVIDFKIKSRNFSLLRLTAVVGNDWSF